MLNLRAQLCFVGVQNPERVVEGYTEEFEESFLELLRRSHPHSRVAAKVVYNDYIADKCALASLQGMILHIARRLCCFSCWCYVDAPPAGAATRQTYIALHTPGACRWCAAGTTCT